MSPRAHRAAAGLIARGRGDQVPGQGGALSFQSLILDLQRFWAEQGCVILQPYDIEVGAGTFHPATALRALGPEPWRAAYVQPSRRPTDGRYGENPNRVQQHYQLQVILKPAPADSQELYLASLAAIGIDASRHDIRFVEDDWESPTLGAWGLGWEIWLDGMEVSQFTYFQQVGGIECDPVSTELTYGLERLAMYVQGVESMFDLDYNGASGPGRVTYGHVFKRAERELLAAETRFRLLVEQLPAITYMAGFGADGEWSYVSPQIEAILGFTPTEWMADPKLWFQRLHPEDAGRVIGLEEKSRASGQPYSAEYRLQARDGKYHWFTDIATVVRDANGVESLQGVITDVTQTKMLEAQFRQAQKMEAVGQLAGGIAHDFNNLLMVIRGHTDLLLNSGGGQPRENIVQIQKAADRAAALTRQLLAFSRMQVLQPEVLDLNRVVADMASMIERLFGSNIEFIFSTEPELGRVRADAGQLEQVLLNLAVNARDAMPGGGCLRIRTENVSFAPGDPRPLPAIGDGEYAALIVRDTGEGMDAETQARIFEPFFTTKEKGRGTGLGLATVYGIVKQSGGFIFVDSAPGQGAAFTIYLPRVNDVESVAKTEQLPEVARHGAETILVVDDENGIRDLAAEYLEGCGYTVLTASGGIEAGELIARYGGPIHLLLTDTVMPRMTGHELVRAVLAVRPEIKVIYMSGYLEFNASAQIQSGDGALYIQKPFSLDALGKIVRSAIESATETASRQS